MCLEYFIGKYYGKIVNLDLQAPPRNAIEPIPICGYVEALGEYVRTLNGTTLFEISNGFSCRIKDKSFTNATEIINVGDYVVFDTFAMNEQYLISNLKQTSSLDYAVNICKSECFELKGPPKTVECKGNACS